MSSLPELLHAQAEWLASARSRLLRRISVARRRRVLDLGAGVGTVTGELARRSGGLVTAVDVDAAALAQGGDAFAGAVRVVGDGRSLPFAAAAFDLVFCQCVLMYVLPLETAVSEIHRVLAPGGVLVALEPEYGGMIEHPASVATREVWLAALERAGANPYAARQLPALLTRQRFEVRVSLLEELAAPAAERFDFLRTLPLTTAEETAVTAAEAASADHTAPWAQVAHLPFFLITALKRD